jgi:hypothetical protein
MGPTILFQERSPPDYESDVPIAIRTKGPKKVCKFSYLTANTQIISNFTYEKTISTVVKTLNSTLCRLLYRHCRMPKMRLSPI